MMKVRRLIPLLAASLAVLAFTVLAASEPDNDIIVERADAVRKEAISADQGLLNTIAGVGARVVVQYANTIRHIALPTLPGDLQTRLDQVAARITVQYANTIRHIALPALPGNLQTLLDQVSARIVIQYANTNRRDALVVIPGTLQTLLGQVPDRIILRYAKTNRGLPLVYPAALINDTTPPQCSGLIASTRGIGTVIIAWATDEFATSTVLYGTQPGVYSQTVSDPLYTKQHSITLTGLTPGTIPYYYVVRSTDRSGNTATSSEYTFNTQPFVYLPLIMRRSP